MFTVGYGDTYPHTVVGKVFAVVLMFTGIALFGWLTGALASLFVESANEVEAKRQRDHMQQQLNDMARQLKRMEQAITDLGKDRLDADRSAQLPATSDDARSTSAATLG